MRADCVRSKDFLRTPNPLHYHHATQRDPVGIKPLSEFCARQKGVIGLLLDMLEHEPENAAILRRWGGM
jgi:hypothetical protein